MESTEASVTSFDKYMQPLRNRFQRFLDQVAPHTIPRWVVTATFLLAFLLRVFISMGWFIIAYALGIYMLTNLISFLTPKGDDEGPVLPTKNETEFRPFERQLPEFKFWLKATRATVLALLATMFRILDVPVFWPILVAYFLGLTFVSMRKRIQHMIRHKYLPFSTGKKTYGNS